MTDTSRDCAYCEHMRTEYVQTFPDGTRFVDQICGISRLPCAEARKGGPILSRIVGTCGRDGRYFQAAPDGAEGFVP